MRQPVQVIVLLGRRHAGGTALFEHNLAYQGRIGKVAVGGGVVVAVVDGEQTRGVGGRAEMGKAESRNPKGERWKTESLKC